jgi:hypothetical protein
MSTTTTNLGLVKPYGSEYPDISILNGNMDIIDGAIADIFKSPASYSLDLNSVGSGFSTYNPSTSNIPESSTYGFCMTVKDDANWHWTMQVAMSTYKQVYFRNNINNEGWTAWEKFVKYEPYTRNITLIADRGSGNKEIQVYKVDGCVYVKLNGYNVGDINSRTDVATLPAGYRPPTETGSTDGYFFVEPGGEIRCTPSMANTQVWDGACFPAYN